MRRIRLSRERIAPLLLFLSAALGVMAAFVPWLRLDIYETSSPGSVFHWQSSMPLSPLPDLFRGHHLPFVLGYPPSNNILVLLLFGPPTLTLLLALAARPESRLSPRWLALACLGAGLLTLAQIGYVLALFLDPLHFYEMGVIDEFITSLQPGVAFAVGAAIATIAAGVALLLSRRPRAFHASSGLRQVSPQP